MQRRALIVELLILCWAMFPAEASAQDPYYYGATSTGVVHYISDCQVGAIAGCVAGSDSNNGTSPSTPWKTIDKAQGDILYNTPPGRQYLFARGGSFVKSTADIRLADYSSDRNNPILFDAYTPSWATDSSPNPIITMGVDSGYMFDFQNGGGSVHDEGYIIRHFTMSGGGHSTITAINLFADADYVLIENNEISGFNVAVGIGMGGPLAGYTLNSQDYITIRNNNIHDNSGMGFLGGGNYLLIDNNRFDNNGFSTAVFDHNVYLTGDIYHYAGHTIRNNTLTRNCMFGGTCSSTSLVVHGDHQGMIIEGNTIQESVGTVGGGCWGIAVVPGYDAAYYESFADSIIRGNKVINVGNLGIAAAACPNCIIENNVVVQEQPGNGFVGIKLPGGSIQAIDSPDNAATIRNNSIYISSAVTVATGIFLGTQGSGHKVVSNAIHYLGNGSSGWNCFDTTGLTSSAFTAFDNNLCDFPNAATGKWEKTAGSLAAWRTASGLDANSLQADPQFTSPGTPNFDLTIAIGSPPVDHGSMTYSSPMDFTGAPRDLNPDIGAYEEGATGTWTGTETGTGVDAGLDSGVDASDAGTSTGTSTATSTSTSTSTSTNTNTVTHVAPGKWWHRIKFW